MEALLIYPHQLYKNHIGLKEGRRVILVEEPLFFTERAVHKQKLMLHRLSMQAYQEWLEEQGFDVEYIHLEDLEKTADIAKTLKTHSVKKVFVADVTDTWLEKRLKEAFADSKIELQWLPSQIFILGKDEAKKRYIDSKKFMKNFYRSLRIDKDILMNNNEPQGGKWSFDEDNRKKLPKDIELPQEIQFIKNDEVEAIKKWVKNLPGEIYGDDTFWIPYTHESAEEYFEEFLEERFEKFGDYEDAISRDDTRIFHSTISPMMNIGLLDPHYVIERAIQFAEKNETPLNCLEGFVRQILGWREFIRASYECDGGKMRTKNFWNHTHELPQSFWEGTTEIDPVDDSVKRALTFGYNHHIERLMVLGNSMLLLEIHPNEVYRWFMAMYVDSYDWVMVPNVYGMSQFADGGIFATKPYLSGANYIKKMSNYSKGPWEEIMTSLYWRFIDKHKEFFLSNPRLAMMPRLLEKMGEEKLNQYKKCVEEYRVLISQNKKIRS